MDAAGSLSNTGPSVMVTTPVSGGGAGDDTLFVTGLYHDLLGRSADAAGLTGLQSIVDSARGRVLNDQALSFVTSAETRSKLAISFYKTYLGRTPSQVEIDGWLAALQGSSTPEQVGSAFVSSPEYFQKKGGTNTTWLDRIYLDLLGRNRDPRRARFPRRTQQGHGDSAASRHEHPR